MTISIAFAIFAVLAFALLALFCLFTRCFANKRKQAANNLFLDGQLETISPVACQGYYQKYRQSRDHSISKSCDKTKEENYILLEMSDLRKVIAIDNDIYSAQGSLKRKLRQHSFQETDRSVISLKQFHPNKIFGSNTQRKKNWQYVQQIISYTAEGINILLKISQVLSMYKEIYKLDYKLQQKSMNWLSSQYNEYLEIMGFQQGEYCYYKYICRLNVQQFRQGQRRWVKNIQRTSSKQKINFQEFQLLKRQIIENSCKQ